MGADTVHTRARPGPNGVPLVFNVCAAHCVCLCPPLPLLSQIFMLASAARAVCVVIREGADPEPLLLKQLLRGRDASPEEQLGF